MILLIIMLDINTFENKSSPFLVITENCFALIQKRGFSEPFNCRFYLNDKLAKGSRSTELFHLLKRSRRGGTLF